jgi:hemerythrin-like domain-containing protein
LEIAMGTERMSPDELAKWMAEEREALIKLNQLLRQHIAVLPEVNGGDWLRGLRAAFDRLRAHLARHFAAKEEDGYLKIVVERRPTLSNEVDHIRQEHDEILQMADQITRDAAETNPENRLLLNDLCSRIQRFVAVVSDHDRREAMITFLVCNEDIGGME